MCIVGGGVFIVFRWAWFWSAGQSARRLDTWDPVQNGFNEFVVNERKTVEEKTMFLNQVVEGTQSLRILALVDVNQRSNFARRERDVILAKHHLQLLAPDAIRSRPQIVVFLEDFGVLDDAFQFLNLFKTYKN